MADNKTTFLENKVLDAVFNGATWATIPNVWVALFTADPTEAGTQTSEVTGGAYARVQTAPADWAAAANGALSNSNPVTFPAPTANWGTVTHVGIMDASTAGNMLYKIPLGTSRTINNGDGAPSFAAGALTFEEN